MVARWDGEFETASSRLGHAELVVAAQDGDRLFWVVLADTEGEFAVVCISH